MTPCAVRRSIVGVESSATIRATGVPRSVMTTSVPSRAASIHRPRFARSSVTATSITEVYITGGQQTYGGPTPHAMVRASALKAMPGWVQMLVDGAIHPDDFEVEVMRQHVSTAISQQEADEYRPPGLPASVTTPASA